MFAHSASSGKPESPDHRAFFLVWMSEGSLCHKSASDNSLLKSAAKVLPGKEDTRIRMLTPSLRPPVQLVGRERLIMETVHRCWGRHSNYLSGRAAACLERHYTTRELGVHIMLGLPASLWKGVDGWKFSLLPASYPSLLYLMNLLFKTLY